MQARAELRAPFQAGQAELGPGAEERLEGGEVVSLAVAPFALPAGDDHAFLLGQQPGARHKHITYNPHRGTVTGWSEGGDVDRLATILAGFSRSVQSWLPVALPHYAAGLEVDRVTFRPAEEATRRLRRNARNDLLHVDAFPGRPARGRRILRVFANIHPSEERVWLTTMPLRQLLGQLGDRVRRSSAGWLNCWGVRLADHFRPRERRHLDSDLFMLRLHDFLKAKVEFQLRSPRRLWKFAPGSAWLAMTDACCHAELRGRYALEHSFFVSPAVLACPELAPARLVAAA
jgi:hypothetical protein